VVDGSEPRAFARHHEAWSPFVTHVRTDSRYRCANGKVANVLTGLSIARHERVVIADDDVRYDEPTLRAVVALLDGAELAVPQNYFDPLPWHAVWDSARTLVNRSFWHDFAGTLAVRRSVASGGYDGDVLFENLELERTVRARGGRVRHARDVYVRRLPPPTRKFFSQRVRQAYDELARPVVLAVWLAIAPALAAVAWRAPPAAALVFAGATTSVAEVGRRRAGGARFFPFRTSLAAPCWVAERAVCAWLALGTRAVFGGVRYGSGRIRRAASSPRRLARISVGPRAHSGARI
jgi:hypothetical protein